MSHHYPVDNATYNLMQALVSKLEAIEVYEKYSKDDDTGIFQELLQEEQQHAQRLLQAVQQKMGGQQSGSMGGGSQSGGSESGGSSADWGGGSMGGGQG